MSNFNFNGLKNLVREPALLIDLAESVVLMVVAFGIGLSGDQQNYIVAAVVALLGLLKAFMTRPFAVAALTDFGRAALVLLASFGVGLTADQIAVAVTTLGLITTVVIRAQITPTKDPVVQPGGAGAGPVAGAVRNEFGAYSVLGSLGALLVLVSVLLLVLTLLKVIAVSITLIVVAFVLGLVLLFLDRGRTGRGF